MTRMGALWRGTALGTNYDPTPRSSPHFQELATKHDNGDWRAQGKQIKGTTIPILLRNKHYNSTQVWLWKKQRNNQSLYMPPKPTTIVLLPHSDCWTAILIQQWLHPAKISQIKCLVPTSIARRRHSSRPPGGQPGVRLLLFKFWGHTTVGSHLPSQVARELALESPLHVPVVRHSNRP